MEGARRGRKFLGERGGGTGLSAKPPSQFLPHFRNFFFIFLLISFAAVDFISLYGFYVLVFILCHRATFIFWLQGASIYQKGPGREGPGLKKAF